MFNTTIDLANLTSSQGFAIQGATAWDYSGLSVSNAGDINNDGYDDVIIGAPEADPNSRTSAGTSYVIFGKSSGFSTIDLASFSSGSSGFIIQGAASYYYSGISVSGAGDVNGDGYDDVIIGAHSANPNSRSQAGTSYVIFGKASGFSTIDLASFSSGSSGFIIQGATSGDKSGESVSGAGDVNGDGYADVIVSAYLADPNSRTDAGASYIIFGKASGFSTIDLASFSSGSSGFIVQGAAAGDATGWSVSRAGDVNGDGYDDVIIGSYGADPNSRDAAGTSYVIFGKASGFSTIDLASFSSGSSGFIIQGAEAYDCSGISVSGIGDINGDGYDDVIVGAHGADPNGRLYAGTSYVIFGKASGFSTIDLASFSSGLSGFIIQGGAYGDRSGISVSGAGDVNDDGYDDVIIGADYASPNNRTEAGTSYIIFGKSSGFSTINLADGLNSTQGFMIQGAVADDYSGISVSKVGDVDGDGYDDVIVGAYGANPNSRTAAGASYVIFGGAQYKIPTSAPTAAPSEPISNSPTAAPSDSPSAYPTASPTSYVIVSGTSNNDMFIATSRSEKFIGNGGKDTVSYINSDAGVTIDLTTGQGSGGYAQKDIYTGISDITGSSYADMLAGDNNANNIAGGSGDDIIEGRGGADILDGGSDTDTLSYANSPSGVTVNLNVGTCSGGDAQGDTFTNFENLIGSQYNDKLTGDVNANTIKGGNGNDIIQGNGGNDILYGEDGVDTFKLTSLSGIVRIKDFNITAHEKLDFSSFKELAFVSDLDIENAGTSTQISFLNGEGQVILENVVADQLMESHFIFTPQMQASTSWINNTVNKLIVVGTTVGAISAIAGFSYGIYCNGLGNKETPFCKAPLKFLFYTKPMELFGCHSSATTVATTTITVAALPKANGVLIDSPVYPCEEFRELIIEYNDTADQGISYINSSSGSFLDMCFSD